MSSIDLFINSFEPGSPERGYYTTLREILSAIEFDESNVFVGLGLLEFLAIKLFYLDEHDFLNDGVAVSRTAASELVAVVFCQGSHEPGWWRCESLKSSNSELTRPLLQWWTEQFRKSPCVTKVI